MGLFTLTTNAKINLPPSRIGDLWLNLNYNQLYTFTIADFTTNVSPTYQDPEGDEIENIKILSLPSVGLLTLNSIVVNINDEISKASVDSGLLQYQCDVADLDGYTDSDLTYDVSDVGSNSYSGLTPGIVNFVVAAKENLPPDEVGDNSLTTDYGETIVFTTADFTTNTTPPYSDPEGDNASLLKILTVPAAGTLYNNGVAVVPNTIISFSNIDLGLLTYVPNLADTDGDVQNFTFAIADEGSGTFTT